MGLIREPLDVDFYVVNRPPTEEESRMMSEFIKKDKAKRAKALARKEANKPSISPSVRTNGIRVRNQ
jgi:hypothetical protein